MQESVELNFDRLNFFIMEFTEFSFGLNDENRRLDKILRKFLKNSSLSEIYSLIRKKLIRINDKKSKPEYKIQNKDKLKIATFLLEKKEENLTLSKAETSNNLEIIYKSEDLIFINKPYNVEVHGKSNSLDEQIKNLYKSETKNNSLSFLPGPLHRLDKLTTGILTFSQSLNGAVWFTENIKNHSIKKTYVAVLEGIVEKSEKWTDFINSEEKIKKSNFFTVKINKNQISEQYKNAVSIINPIKYEKVFGVNVTVAEIQILTGRTHQIRCQSAFHNHPLIGDIAYGGKKIESSREFFLHAWKLNLPKTEKIQLPEEVISDYEKDLNKFLFK